ncbi:hypothetical protein HQ37_07265 [Porphyromonas sp. COT-239 OH1446]|nr:hypothetical protein HQ37_07265 [Porphyromonas sp. COT-239 OH1446]
MSRTVDIQRINVQVEGETLQMRIPRADEPLYRDAATELRLTVNAYKDKYPNSSEMPNSGYLMMAGLDLAYRARLLSEQADTRAFASRLAALNREMEGFLSTIVTQG